MAYAILRIAKHSSTGSLGAMTKHNKRTMEVPNADPEKTQYNYEAFGSSGDYVKEVEKIIAREKLHTQKNSVLAIEHLMTASPEFFKFSKTEMAIPDKKQRNEAYWKRFDKWIDANKKFLEEYYGPHSKIASISVHLDESTPHLHAFIVPITEGKLKGGRTVKRLGAKAFTGDDKKIRPGQTKRIGGRDKLRAMQDLYAEKMREFGLERGIEGSKAKHQTMKALYGKVNKAEQIAQLQYLKAPQIEELPPLGFGREKWVEEQNEKIKEAIQEPIKDRNDQILANHLINASETLKIAKIKREEKKLEKEKTEYYTKHMAVLEKAKENLTNTEKALESEKAKVEKLSSRNQSLEQQLEQRLVNLKAREDDLKRLVRGEMTQAQFDELKQRFANMDKKQNNQQSKDNGMNMI